ncbi:MAG TPA: sensor histidine kinase [Paenibacillaceae bacterium]
MRNTMLYSLRSRLIALLSLLLFCSFGLVYFVLFNESRAIIRGYIESSALEKMDEYGSVVRMALTQIYDLSSIIFNSDMTRKWDDVMSNPAVPDNEKTLASISFSQFLTRTLYNYSGVSSVTLYRKEGFWVGVENRMARDGSFLDEAWYKDFINGRHRWVPAHTDPVEAPGAAPYPVVSLLLPIGTFKPELAHTVMKVNVRAEYFQEPLSRIHLGETGSIFLLDAEGRPMLFPERFGELSEQARGVVASGIPGSSQGVLYLTEEPGNREILVYKRLRPYDWLLVGVVSERELFAKLTGLRNTMVASAALLFVLSVAAAMWISHGVSKPLSRLAIAMRHVQKGDFEKAESRLPPTRRMGSEVAFVMESFRNMVGLLRQHIRTEFELKLLRQQAEYKALLMQINPHFLFNTLELMSSLAIQRRSKDTVRVIEALGKMLRFSLQIGERVPLEEELRYVRHYLDILGIRFRDRLSVTIREEGSPGRVPVMKFVLQPLVENAVKFSASQEGTAVVEIAARLDGDRLVLCVADNGPGMPPELVERLQTESPSVQLDEVLNRPKGRIGLRNTLARLRLHYGPQFAFRIESGEGKGTRIELMLPAEPVEGGDEADAAGDDCG